MADDKLMEQQVEEMRRGFIGRVRGDLTNLYRVYCRMSEFAQVIGDDDLKKAVEELLKVWDDLSNTAAVKVIANGFVEWIRTGCGPTPEEAKDGVERLMGDEALRSNLLDEEWKAGLEVGRKWLDAGVTYDDVRRAMAAVNNIMGWEWTVRGDVWKAVLAVLIEVSHDAA